LPEPGIEFVFDDGREPGPVSPAMQMADAEVLFHDISDFGDGLVAQDLRLGQLGGGGVLAHDAVFDLIEGEKVPVGLTGVAFIGIDFFDLLFGEKKIFCHRDHFSIADFDGRIDFSR